MAGSVASPAGPGLMTGDFSICFPLHRCAKGIIRPIFWGWRQVDDLLYNLDHCCALDYSTATCDIKTHCKVL
jgi:hypothetical protein